MRLMMRLSLGRVRMTALTLAAVQIYIVDALTCNVRVLTLATKSSLHPTPCTLQPTPYTLHPQPYI